MGWDCPTEDNAGFTVAFGVKGLRDIIPLRTLLRAAGVDSTGDLYGLDRPSYATPVESLRYAGLVMVVKIHYENTFRWEVREEGR